MPIVAIAGQHFDVDAVIFDKDGTLVAFEAIWGPRTALWLEELAELCDIPALQGALGRAIGFDPATGAILPDGPIAVASLADIYAIAASTLYQYGVEWHEGYPLATRVAARTLDLPPSAAEVQPRGEVAATLQRLHDAGVAIGVATNDERHLTQAALDALGISSLVRAMVCGDDPFLPKPDAAGLQWLAAELGTTAERMIMVGDSGTDMLAGRNAAVRACVGFAGGAGSRDTLARTADVVIELITQIEVGEAGDPSLRSE